MRDITIKQGDYGEVSISETVGSTPLIDLTRDELLEEAIYTERRWTELRTKRHKRALRAAAICATFAIVAIIAAYWILIYKRMITFADIFNGFAPSVFAHLLLIVFPALTSLAFGTAAHQELTDPTPGERTLAAHQAQVNECAEIRGWDDKAWRAALRKRLKRPDTDQ